MGYFTSWVQQQVIERYGAQRAFAGGLKVKTTLDLELQRAAEAAVNSYFGEEGPTASLVAIENSTGEVRAMVGGRNYDRYPFNLATDGERQPGSAFKAFDLAAALEHGISPYSVWSSKQKVFVVHSPNGPERFVVHNDEGAYSGSNTLVGATAFSDNSIYAEVGLKAELDVREERHVLRDKAPVADRRPPDLRVLAGRNEEEKLDLDAGVCASDPRVPEPVPALA